ncbi:MAG: sulfatase-like hydrolase/transferase, partial [Acidimicrobiia bacterium]|nr:sulfatase-like hydrolase/transferase [Acidimicrobiia bacterium]
QLSPWARTPNLDALAAEGVTFTEAVTNAPVCMPARMALATGTYPHNFGLYRNGPYPGPPAGFDTWMRAVRDSGYHTALFGKLHLHTIRGERDVREHVDRVHELGFDEVMEVVDARGSLDRMSEMTDAWREAGVYDAFKDDLDARGFYTPHFVRPAPLPLELYYDVFVPQRARAHLASLPADRPWCCVVGFPGPHEPWDAPEPYASAFDPADMPAPTPEIDLGDDPVATSFDDLQSRFDLRADELARLRADYAGSVLLIDEQVGELLDVVRRRGEWDDTVVVFASDHGEMNGDHGLVWKNTFLDGALRIPLIVRAPGQVGAGRVSDELVELLDVGTTFVDYAGGSMTSPTFGRSLRPLLEDAAAPGRSHVVSEFAREQMIMDTEHKLVVNADDEPAWLLDRRDPSEARNCLRDPDKADVVAALGERLRAWRSATAQPTAGR